MGCKFLANISQFQYGLHSFFVSVYGLYLVLYELIVGKPDAPPSLRARPAIRLLKRCRVEHGMTVIGNN